MSGCILLIKKPKTKSGGEDDSDCDKDEAG